MNDNLANLEAAIEGPLAKQIPTPEYIRELIGSMRSLPMFSVSDEEAEALARKFEERHGVTMTIGAMLTDRNYEPWLDSARAGIDPYYWDRYRRLLASKGYSSQVLATMDDVTDRILDRLENPLKEGEWDRRGMVVGHVQSGKTANYTGLICKAADAGYRLVVVIAGIHNNLRNQTQSRIDEGFVGRDSARRQTEKDRRIIGVGRYDSTRLPWTFTTSVRDFNKIGAEQVGGKLSDLSVPAVFVIKKNSSTLKNLLEWLREYNSRSGNDRIDAPMLLIDDEADNASINIKHGKGEVSRINGQIRDLLKVFRRSCYVGYTATPFANIFIDPDSNDELLGDELFPRNFIVSLEPPDNYFGPERVFVHEADKIIRHIEDNEDFLPIKHPKDTEVVELPPSLLKAMRAFVLAKAIRLARGHAGQHSSMLINASRFTDVQRQIRNVVHAHLEDIQASARLHCALPPESALRNAEIASLKAVWDEEYNHLEFKWPAIQKLLHEAVAPIRVVEVNSRSSGSLDYADNERDGLNVIAVGGFSLSRGLTLEGLMTSYFLRNSMMYDTLMQMGRWFGYRPGYDDLCRVWMPEEAEGWYAHIAESVDALRDELRRMEAAGATPEEFGLKVRSHPDTLIVTARNKMGTGERVVVRIGLGNSFVETAILRRDRDALSGNRRAAVQLARALAEVGYPLSDAEQTNSGFLLRAAPVNPILDFLSTFQNHPGSMLTDPEPVRRYIEDRMNGELREWDILFASTTRMDARLDESLGIPIRCQRRTAGTRSDADTLRITNKQRVASRGVERAGLSDEQIEEAERDYADDQKNRGKTSATLNYPDRIYRKKRSRPLLIVHLLEITDGGRTEPESVVAWGISFPVTALEERHVEYIVNTTWLRENYRNDLDEDEMAGDDDE